MRPENLTAKIFLDSGDPAETREALRVLGFLDGQTTNPSLVAKNPEIQKTLSSGARLSEQDIYARYREIVSEISRLIPDGSVSIEVYADHTTSAEVMFAQGRQMYLWIPNAHVKYPILESGLAAAQMSVAAGMRVNMTLCFTQEQALAVYAATRGAKRGDVFVSPFVGRLDDQGENGMALVKNILAMYKNGDGHVEVLSASIRTMDHFMASLAFGADIVTAPLRILKAWGEAGMPIPDNAFAYNTSSLQDIPYEPADMNCIWKQCNYQHGLTHELTEKGIDRFVSDWNALIQKS